MKIVSIGGGPAGLFFAILMKRADPEHEVIVLERNRCTDTFGFGVVFSDTTMANLADADPKTNAEITRHFSHWDNIDIRFNGRIMTSTGHGFSGLSRKALLGILSARCEELGVDLRFETEVDDITPWLGADLVLGADGVNSLVREQYSEHFRPTIDWRSNRFTWLGSTKPLDAFTFDFKTDENGLWRLHAYEYEEGHSTWIVETNEQTWKASGMDQADEAGTLAYVSELFADELDGYELLANRSLWRKFPTVRNERWSHDNIVLIGDAAHTAHFSVGSGTKLALEDAIALADAVQSCDDVPAALAHYEAERRQGVESLQRAAQVSLEWFENTERYMGLDLEPFCFGLLTRSLRVSHQSLKLRDPEFVAAVDREFADEVAATTGLDFDRDPVPPPAFTPFVLRGMAVDNRIVVSPMCQYSACNGTPSDWHLVHLGSRAVGGAGLIITEMTNVSEQGRITHGCAGIYSDEHVAAWKRIVDFVHGHSSAKIGIQLGHSGRKGSCTVPWKGDCPLPDAEGWPTLAPSPLPFRDGDSVPVEMDETSMKRVIDEYRQATRRAEDAGFDLIEVHMAHGYLLSSFISPLSNVRNDDYGGDLSGRMKFPLEVLDAVREEWSEAKPISVRISAVDWADGGLTSNDAVEVARMLGEHGCDIVDVSSGGVVADAQPVYGRQYQTPLAEQVRIEAGIPTIAVGNISSAEDANSIVASRRADLVAIARAHLWDPYWSRHAAHQIGHELSWPDPYGPLDSFTPRTS